LLHSMRAGRCHACVCAAQLVRSRSHAPTFASTTRLGLPLASRSWGEGGGPIAGTFPSSLVRNNLISSIIISWSFLWPGGKMRKRGEESTNLRPACRISIHGIRARCFAAVYLQTTHIPRAILEHNRRNVKETGKRTDRTIRAILRSSCVRLALDPLKTEVTRA